MIRKSGNLDSTDRFENRGDGIAFGEPSLNWHDFCEETARLSSTSLTRREFHSLVDPFAAESNKKNPRKTNLGDC